MDALKLLKEDHVTVKKMLSELDDETERAGKTPEEGFARIQQELEVHEAIEDEIFYPALKDHPKTTIPRQRSSQSAESSRATVNMQG